jgi:AhpD family alkylhydroperoxidase
MKAFTVPGYEQVDETVKPVFDQYKKLLGFMPNLYATIGYSAVTLNSYIAYTSAQTKGSFHAKEREAIYLMVSQLNYCEYCLASHTASALRNGWKEEDTLLLRAGKYPDKKWEVIYAVVKSVIDNRGAVSDELLEAFFALGYQEKALMDLLALISIMSFTNYAYRLTRIPIDYPPAKEI